MEEPHVVEEIPGMLKLLTNGSVIREPINLKKVLYQDAKYPSVTWDDITYDPVNHLQLRLYKPGSNPNPNTIIFFIHGGGGCFGSREQWSDHNLCLRLGAELGAVVVSVDYRLAPENRLPAAAEDCWTALKWVKTIYNEGQGVYLFGESAGGTFAHHVAVQIASGGSSELKPVQVKGCVLLAPGFGGVERTKSELECPVDSHLNLAMVDSFFRLCLPIGETTDHPFVNPFGPASPNLELLDLGPMLIMVGDTDILRDRVKEYANRLSKSGKIPQLVEFEGQEHGFVFSTLDPEPVNQVFSLIKRFISENSG